eukprot:scaffold67026_cov52-Attheya_sp.AAC.3
MGWSSVRCGSTRMIRILFAGVPIPNSAESHDLPHYCGNLPDIRDSECNARLVTYPTIIPVLWSIIN